MGTKELMDIKRFSEYTGIPASTLRYYDQNGIFAPIHKDGNGRRKYHISQVTTANLIKFLVSAKVPLAMIKDFVANRDDYDYTYRTLREQEYQISSQIQDLQLVQQSIGVIKDMINEVERIRDLRAIVLQPQGERHIAVAPENKPFAKGEYYDAFTKAWKVMEGFGYRGNFPIGGYTRNFIDFMKRPWSPDNFFSLNPRGFSTMRAGTYVVAYTQGDYGEDDDVVERLQTFIRERKLKIYNGVYQIYIRDEVTSGNPERYISKVMVRVQDGAGAKVAAKTTVGAEAADAKVASVAAKGSAAAVE
jgi:DNA-binding transcriptional MerR regulator